MRSIVAFGVARIFSIVSPPAAVSTGAKRFPRDVVIAPASPPFRYFPLLRPRLPLHKVRGAGMDASEKPDWKSGGVKVIRGDSLDTNTAQTPGMNRAAAINYARVG